MTIPDAEISAVRFSLSVVDERYILRQKCVKNWIGSAVGRPRWYNFQPPIHRPWAPQWHSTHRHRETADRNILTIQWPSNPSWGSPPPRARENELSTR